MSDQALDIRLTNLLRMAGRWIASRVRLREWSQPAASVMMSFATHDMGTSSQTSGVARALNVRSLMMGLAGLVVFGAACGFFGGWWFSQKHENPNAIS